MRDSYVFALFGMFIIAGTFLAYTGKVEPQLIITPIVTGFLGLLASTRQTSKKEEEHMILTGAKATMPEKKDML